MGLSNVVKTFVKMGYNFGGYTWDDIDGSSIASRKLFKSWWSVCSMGYYKYHNYIDWDLG